MKLQTGVTVSFLVPKANGKVRLSLDVAWLNKALIGPVHQVSTLNDILSKQIEVKYLMLIDAAPDTVI